ATETRDARQKTAPGAYRLRCNFRRRRLFLLHTLGMRLVDAERLFIEIIAGSGKGAGTTTHANVAEFAAAAFPLQVVDIAQFIKHHRVLPDLGKGLLPQISCQGWQVSAGVDLTLMRDETDRGSGQASLGHGVHVGRMRSRMSHCLSNTMRLQFDAG